MADEAMLAVSKINAFYGESHILHDVSFDIRKGEVVTLLGRNGAGKTTSLRAIMGNLKGTTGSIHFDGNELIGRKIHEIPKLGIGYVPEERAIFASLNVLENLLLPPAVAKGGMTVDEIYQLFPNLKGRDKTQGTRLSGGEQQMLAIARILRTGARFILLDEPTEGLAPVIIEQIGHAILTLKNTGYTMILVEQNFRFATTIADRHFVMEEGHVIDELSAAEVLTNPAKLERYLGV